MRHAADARRGAARILTALAVLIPAATSSSSTHGSSQAAASAGAAAGLRRALVGEEVAVGFRGSLDAATVRRLQEDECTEQTSIGDAESGIAQYEDEDACLREGPLVGCNGEWLGVQCIHAAAIGAAFAACSFVRRENVSAVTLLAVTHL